MSKKIEDWAMARESLREELDAINKYEERIAATEDTSLKKLLQHNSDEEKEHVAMLVEWLRENDPTQDKVFEEHD
ncbi:MAG: ferritin [Dehalococcoidia bacterium]